MADDILKEQLDYYRARAREYDRTVQQLGQPAPDAAGDPAVATELAHIRAALHRLPPCAEALELACGTGIWTQELLKVAQQITALDGAPEMLDVNEAKLGSLARVRYECIDLFTWQPGHPYDLVFFAFWLSHVPLERLGNFLEKVARAVQVGGHLFIVDEPGGGKLLSGAADAESTQTRRLEDGREFRIVKAYYEPGAIQRNLARRGFGEFELFKGDYFFALRATKLE